MHPCAQLHLLLQAWQAAGGLWLRACGVLPLPLRCLEGAGQQSNAISCCHPHPVSPLLACHCMQTLPTKSSWCTGWGSTGTLCSQGACCMCGMRTWCGTR